MKKLLAFFREFRFPRKGEARAAVASFSRRDLAIFLSLFGILAVTTILLLNKINLSFMSTVPTRGGSISEGVIGIPRFINPVLAVSDADKDMTELVYSGLMRRSATDGFIPELAESYAISDDGLTYTFTLKEGIEFHDGEAVTADDVVYTIQQIQDSTIKSPKKVSWEGVTVTKIDDRTVEFTLKTAYAPFIEQTTIGILPAHIWKNVPSDQFSFTDFNTDAVGAGPFKVVSISKSSSGVPKEYELEAVRQNGAGPYIKDMTVKFYANERELVSALRSGAVDNINSISPESATELAADGYRIETSTLPRIFGLFFNQSQAAIFLDKTVVTALDMAIDKHRIVETVLGGYGVPIDSPVPAHFLNMPEGGAVDTATIEDARALLEKNGWKSGADGVLEKKQKTNTTRLAFSIATGDTPELKRAAELIKQDFEALGASIELKVFDIGNLNQSVIRPRKYDALFFGEVVSHESDLFAFWHSSQRNDPGLNIAMYTSARSDKLLEESLTEFAREDRIVMYQKFEAEVAKDKPAIFVYSPKFIYAINKRLGGFDFSNVSIPSDRLGKIKDWYVETEGIWKVFTQ